jgi:uncharacterized integral membrane protein
MSRTGWLILILVGVGAGLFAYFNGAERVTLRLGFTSLYRVPLSTLVLGAFLLGMLTMFGLSLRHDLRLRRELRARDEERERTLPPYREPDPPVRYPFD